MLDRRWWVLGAGSLCVAAYLSVAEAQGPGGRGGRAISPLMQALDADGDGELSAKEIENATVALKTLDRDKNGKLTRQELAGLRPGTGPRQRGRRGRRRPHVLRQKRRRQAQQGRASGAVEIPHGPCRREQGWVPRQGRGDRTRPAAKPPQSRAGPGGPGDNGPPRKGDGRRKDQARPQPGRDV